MHSLSDFRFVRLSSVDNIGSFDCGHKDLNGFLLDDACNHAHELLAVTYLFKKDNRTIAFFSVSNDTIRIEKIKLIPALVERIPKEKRYKNLPAVKIARLGVHKDYKRQTLGTQLLDYIKVWFVKDNKTGCRYITVDAYNEPGVLSFYEKNGFNCFSDKDKNKKARHMYFDLKPFYDTITQQL